MKKTLYIVIAILLSLTMDMKAQSDSFFQNHHKYREIDSDNEWGQLLLLPDEHNVDYNYPANDAALGNELLIMLAMGFTYAGYRKR